MKPWLATADRLSPWPQARVVVAGLGASGFAAADGLLDLGAKVTVLDESDTPENLEKAGLLEFLDAEVRLGPGSTAALPEDADLVVTSPGWRPSAPLLRQAALRGLPIWGEVELAWRMSLPDRAVPWLAVTGTNGKTTTTALTALLVERAGRRAAAAGNIGPTLLDTLAAALQAEDGLPEVWVLELSSFQLDGIEGFEPDAATVLNVTQDHLDWHGTMDAYAAAKARIFGRDALMVVNRDDPLVRAMLPQPPPADAARQSGKSSKAPKFVPRRACGFGLDAPARPGDFGLVEQSGIAWLVRAQPLDEGLKLRKGEAVEVHLQQLMPADALRIRGRHNAANALAALALATAIGCPLAPMLHALRESRGEAHRVEPVAVIGGVEAFDDSKGTNVGATVAALEGLGAEKAPGRLVVILGGDGKGQDFAPLAAPLARFGRAAALIGRDAPALQAALADSGVPLQQHDTLEAATAWCFAQARPGDAVLLSPACASLDMFRNYAHRAEVFVAEVQRVAAERGEVVA